MLWHGTLANSKICCTELRTQKHKNSTYLGLASGWEERGDFTNDAFLRIY